MGIVYTNQLPGSVVENDRQRRPLGSGILLHEEALVLTYVYIYHVIHVCMYIYNNYVYIYNNYVYIYNYIYISYSDTFRRVCCLPPKQNFDLLNSTHYQ